MINGINNIGLDCAASPSEMPEEIKQQMEASAKARMEKMEQIEKDKTEFFVTTQIFTDSLATLDAEDSKYIGRLWECSRVTAEYLMGKFEESELPFNAYEIRRFVCGEN